MRWPTSVGWLVFIAVPGVVWMVGAWANRGHGFAARILGFTVGTDNRLSLSRLQAFLWTLVIFGSFAAAMAIHKSIVPASQAEVDAATKKAKDAADVAAAKKAAFQSAQADMAAAEVASKTAHDTQVEDEVAANVLAAAAKAAPDNKDLATKAQTAQAKVLDAKASDEGKAAVLAEKKKTANIALAFYTQAEDDEKKAQNEVPNSAWVQIPAALLALAGIAIGSGVFSSLISAVNNEQQTASITGIAVVQFGPAHPVPPDPDVQPPLPGHPDSLLIRGADLGATKGTVRFHSSRFAKQLARVIYWRNDEIAIDLAPGTAYPRFTVDTAHGKLTYGLTGAHPNLQLGAQIFHYEFVDLFRDDKNPDTLSLMKFQMFGWTLIAVAIYVYLFLAHLSDHIQTLPMVDSTIATLTGVSQAGYLTGKGVSNLSSN